MFTFLYDQVNAMHISERACCLTLDEMSLQPGVEYDPILSESTLPGHNGPTTHTLVFMLGGMLLRLLIAWCIS